MTLTGKQAYVLDNLERIERRRNKVRTPDARIRFDLDGLDCTSQVTSLVVKKMIRHLPDGSLTRSAGGGSAEASMARH